MTGIFREPVFLTITVVMFLFSVHRTTDLSMCVYKCILPQTGWSFSCRSLYSCCEDHLRCSYRLSCFLQLMCWRVHWPRLVFHWIRTDEGDCVFIKYVWNIKVEDFHLKYPSGFLDIVSNLVDVTQSDLPYLSLTLSRFFYWWSSRPQFRWQLHMVTRPLTVWYTYDLVIGAISVRLIKRPLSISLRWNSLLFLWYTHCDRGSLLRLTSPKLELHVGDWHDTTSEY